MVVTMSWPSLGVAQPAVSDAPTPSPRPQSSAERAPLVLFTNDAKGGTTGTYGAASVGLATFGVDGNVPSGNALGGGVRIWGTPVAPLTFVLEGMRRDSGDFAPAVTLVASLYGSEDSTFSLGALGRYKAEGFAEIEGEIEAGLLTSFAFTRVDVDVNLIAGRGFEEEETDAEALARVGYAVLPQLQLGAEGRARVRAWGEAALAGGRRWDAFGGPSVTLRGQYVFASFMTGPSNTGVAGGLGWLSVLAVGGSPFL